MMGAITRLVVAGAQECNPSAGWRSLLYAVAIASTFVIAGSAGAAPNVGSGRVEVATFLAPQSDLSEPYPGMHLPPDFSEFKDETVRQIARISVGGDALKIKFSNEYGTTPLTLDAVRIAVSLGMGAIDPATSKGVTFDGKPSVTLPPGKDIYSDVIAFPAKPLSELAVSIYMKHADVRTAHRFANTALIGSGDMTASADMSDGRKATSSFYMPEIVAIRSTKADVIIGIGDSLTDGPAVRDAFRGWTDQLAVMIHAAGVDMSVLNGGIGGNRWVRDNMGPCAACRIERDVLNVEGAKYVIFFLGVNDIGLGFRYSNGFKNADEVVTAKQMIDALDRSIKKAKAKGLKVYVATTVPFKNDAGEKGTSDYYTSGKPNQVPYGKKEPLNGEQMRQDVNAFIRSNKTVDGVIDIDRAIADPADPLRERKDLTADSLHMNAAGNSLFARLAYMAIIHGQEK